MQDWFTLWLATVVGTAPFVVFYRFGKWLCGEQTPPTGFLVLTGLLLLGAPFVGYWFFQNFAVVWRP